MAANSYCRMALLALLCLEALGARISQEAMSAANALMNETEDQQGAFGEKVKCCKLKFIGKGGKDEKGRLCVAWTSWTNHYAPVLDKYNRPKGCGPDEVTLTKMVACHTAGCVDGQKGCTVNEGGKKYKYTFEPGALTYYHADRQHFPAELESACTPTPAPTPAPTPTPTPTPTEKKGNCLEEAEKEFDKKHKKAFNCISDMIGGTTQEKFDRCVSDQEKGCGLSKEECHTYFDSVCKCMGGCEMGFENW